MLLDDIEHLPKVVTNAIGIKDVLLAIEPEIIQLREDISDLLKELYVKTTEDFITRWEKDFSLKYDASLTLEQRRQRILNKLARKRPLTWDNLRLLIKNNLAENVQFYLSNDAANYNFRIIINPEMEEVFDASKFTVVGSPTITDDGIASGFSSSNYLTKSLTFPSINKRLDITTPVINISNTFSSQENIFEIYNNTGSNDCCFIRRNSATNLQIYFRASASWVIKDLTIQQGNNYQIRFVWDGSTYYIYTKTNNTDWTLGTSFDDSSVSDRWGNWTIYLGSYQNKPFLGSIDLKQFSITVDGVKVFSGTKRVPKGISEMEKAVRQAKPAYLLFDIIVTDIVRRCGTFNCGTNPL